MFHKKHNAPLQGESQSLLFLVETVYYSEILLNLYETTCNYTLKESDLQECKSSHVFGTEEFGSQG
jgi:hypothetical protein